MIRLVCLLLGTVVGSVNLAPDWTEDYSEALSNARCDRRPMVVVLENPEKVKQRAGSIFHVEREILTKFEICRVDVGSDYGKKVAELYSPSELPYTVITDPECEQIVFRGVGERSINQWTKTLEVHAEDDSSSQNATVNAKSSSTVQAKPASYRRPVAPKAVPFSHPDLAAARAAASANERPLLVYVSMLNCKYCDKMQAETFSDTSVHDLISSRFESVRIEKETHPAFVAENGVSIFPTTLVFSPDGNLLTKIDGYVSAADFRSRVGVAGN